MKKMTKLASIALASTALIAGISTGARATTPLPGLWAAGNLIVAGKKLCLTQQQYKGNTVDVQLCGTSTRQQWDLSRSLGIAVPSYELGKTHLDTSARHAAELIPGPTGHISYVQYRPGEWILRLGSLCLSVPYGSYSVVWERCGTTGTFQVWVTPPWRFI